ncbi:MAG: hypothetical protein K9M97_01275 [Akkermansiaceae bacterium]|nr:hypothetical protein [Akkermansiaceae bacterium]
MKPTAILTAALLCVFSLNSFAKPLKVFILAGQIEEYMKKYEADLISPAELAKWKSGASNFGFHYLGCAQTFALMGKALAQANLKLLKHP